MDGMVRERDRYREIREEFSVKRIEDRKELIFIGLPRKPIKHQTRDLHGSQRPQAPS